MAFLVPSVAYAAARVVGALGHVAPAALALAGTVAAATAVGAATHAGSGVLGYANASAALAVTGAAAALLAASSAHRRWAVGLWAVLLVAALGSGSRAAAVGALVVAASGFAVLSDERPRPRPVTVVLPAAGLLAVLTGGSAAVGSRFGRQSGDGPLPGLITQLSPRRVQLWGDAVDLVTAAPLAGSGPRTFAVLAPAAQDPDTAAAHSLLLEVAAEQGLVGAALVLALLGWVLLRAAVAAADGAGVRLTVVAGLWTAFVLQASVDYIADFWPVTTAGAVVAGLATGSLRTARRRPG
ncbi:MAG: O-antigen ligase family protein [Actinomycetes bacterium]